MTGNEQRAHDLAILLLDHRLNSYSGREISEEIDTIRENAQRKSTGSNSIIASIVDQYQHLYKELILLLN
ncbi:hypothetical protein [Lactiplantibacillus plantarum]|uniref:hypothetical protein n=1 Tax=Lactiplantibacillus plantarum TaxID=1590 RepID=UPI003F53B7A0